MHRATAMHNTLCYRCAIQRLQCKFHTDCYHHPSHCFGALCVLLHATLKQCVLAFCFVHKTEIVQSKYINCCLVTTQDLVFSVYDLSPCTVISHSSIHTFSQHGATALMIASSKGYSSMVRKLLQAGATVNTTNMVCKQVLEVTYPCALCM